MSHAASESRHQLLLDAAGVALEELQEIADFFHVGGSQQRAALGDVRRISEQFRGLLAALREQAQQSAAIAAAGAKLLCSAVRIVESLFTLDERIGWYQATLAKADEFEDRTLKGKLLGNLGNALADAGRLVEAEPVLMERLRLAQVCKDADSETIAREHVGKLLLRRGRFHEAESYLEQAYAHAIQQNNEAAVTRLLADRANVRYHLGDATGCLELLNERLARLQKNQDDLLLLSTHHTLASRLMNLGKLDEARHHAEAALAIAKRLRLPLRRAMVLGTLGDIAYDQSELKAARRHIAQARRVFRQHGNVVQQGNTATSLGLVARKAGNLRQAIRWFGEALAIDRKTNRENDEATDLGNLAETLVMAGDYDQAVETYEQRIAILAALGQRQREGETCLSLARLHAQREQYDEALRVARQAFAIFSATDPSRAAEIKALIEQWETHVT
jgi:tetratricopeptide (TPR) repeat protein